MPHPTPIALTIAGSDSGGGAGVQADLRVFADLGVHGTSAITAVTAQNTVRVVRSVAMSPAIVRAQIDAVADDLPPDAVKTGMLANARVARAAATAIRRHGLAPYVLDPIIRASTGRALLDRAGVTVLRRELVPLAALVTPNLGEAAALLGEPVTDIASMMRAARWLVDDAGAGAALVTGGHLAGPFAIDVFYDGAAPPRRFRHRRIRTRHTHGTGCTLSAAITAHLAKGASLPNAVRKGMAYVHHALLHPPGVGSGHGPVGV
jgi:hydroxymethylpyrimidine kinase/phosphomethylpyrimidine kinase